MIPTSLLPGSSLQAEYCAPQSPRVRFVQLGLLPKRQETVSCPCIVLRKYHLFPFFSQVGCYLGRVF